MLGSEKLKVQEENQSGYIPWSKRAFNPLIGIVLISFIPLFVLFIVVFRVFTLPNTEAALGYGIIMYLAYFVLPVFSGLIAAIYAVANLTHGDNVELKAFTCFLYVALFGYISPFLGRSCLESDVLNHWLNSPPPNPSVAEVVGEWKMTDPSKSLVMDTFKVDASNYIDCFFKIERDGTFTANTLIERSLTKVLQVEVLHVQENKSIDFASPLELSDTVFANFQGRWQFNPLKGSPTGISFFINDSIPITYHFIRSRDKLLMFFLNRGVPIEFEKVN